MTYCDTSFVLDFIAFPLERIFPIKQSVNLNFQEEINKYWVNESRLNKFQKIVEKIYNVETTSQLIYSPLVTLECVEKLVEENFKSLIVKNCSVKSIQRSSRKEIGESLWKIYQDYLKNEANMIENSVTSFALNIFELGIGNADEGLSLFELMPVDMKSISISHNSKQFNLLIQLSQSQIGVTDILHLLIAKELKCDKFLTFDSDFVRMKSLIEEEFDLKILSNFDEIYKQI